MDLYDVLPRDEWISSATLHEMVRRRSKARPGDRAQVDAEFAMALMSGAVVGKADEDGQWSYRRSAKRPSADPGDSRPGGAGYNAALEKAHAAELARLDEEDKRAAEARQRAWETDPHRLQVRAIVDERLRELGLLPVAFAEEAGSL